MTFNGTLRDNGTPFFDGVLAEETGVIVNVADVATVEATALAPTVITEVTVTVADVATITTEALNPRVVISDKSDLSASLKAIRRAYSDIRARIGAIAPGHIDMVTSIYGVPPVNLPASLSINQPRDLTAYIRQGFVASEDLPTELNPQGYHVGMPAFVRPAFAEIRDMAAFIEIKNPHDLRAFIHGYMTSDIGAYLITERIKNLNAIIWPKVVAAANISAYLRLVVLGVPVDLPVTPFKAVVSTHTSDKTPNLKLVSKTFYNNKFLFGTHAKGLVAFNVEPIFGVFPDLHAFIFAQDYFREHITAFIRGWIPTSSDIPTTARAVSPHIKMSKVVLSPHPLKEISASLTQRGGYKNLPAILRTSRKGITGTAPDAAFTTVASSYKFILGTGRGLFIPQQNVPTIRTTLFNNNYHTPDLRATLRGWVVSDFGASIKHYPYYDIPSTLAPVGTDRFRDLRVTIEPAYTLDLMASIGSKGSYYGLQASVSSAGHISSISASVVSYINPLSYNTIPVSTKPFKDMGALINYGSLVGCATKSMFVPMSASIRAFEGGAEKNFVGLGATLNALRQVIGMPAEITGRKRTRIRTLTLSFRANTRGTSVARGIITPVALGSFNLAATIAGLSHETNLGASVNPVRYALENILFTASELAVNLNNPTSTKEILLSFRDKVSSYVFEDISSAVYATEHGTWAIDLRSVKRQRNFFDRDPDSRERVIDDTLEFHSIDEAIRNAISIICDRVNDDMGATLTPTGVIVGLGASMGVTASDMLKDLQTKLVSVAHLPDISATINTSTASSAYASLATLISAGGVGAYTSLPATVGANPSHEIAAEITAI